MRRKVPYCLLALILTFLGGNAVCSAVDVWSHRLSSFSEEEYKRSVEGLFTAFESQSEQRLEAGEIGRVGLKVSTASGPGLATPPHLVRAVVAALEQRGFSKEDIFLIDLSGYKLRQSRLLPPLSHRIPHFEGSPVLVLESGRHYDSEWFYDSPLPPREDARALTWPAIGFSAIEERTDRKSYLPVPLMHEVDFWINLPVYSDHPALGLSGALVNATLQNASNTSRFFRSTSTGPAAIAEMAAVPELRRGWILNLVTLEEFQFIGGPRYHSLYSVSEPLLWMSADPVILDALMLRKINDRREERGFSAIAEDLPLLYYSEEIGVGTRNQDTVNWIRLP